MDLKAKKYAEKIAPKVQITGVKFYIHSANGKLKHGLLNSFLGKEPDYVLEVTDDKFILTDANKKEYAKKLKRAKSIQNVPGAEGVAVFSGTENGEPGLPD